VKHDEVSRHRYIVFGAARSGIAAAHLLQENGADVIVADEMPGEQAAARRAPLDQRGIASLWGSALPEWLDDRDVMILSPGIPPANAFVVEARRRGVRVISEIELASAMAPPESKVIAVTGTNGKTTTTAWTTHLLSRSGFNAVAAGNIGSAWTSVAACQPAPASQTRFVVEVTSFQLETIEDFRPSVALLTNLAPDHLDRYEDYGQYVDAKRNMLRNMRGADSFVYNLDNPDSIDFASGFNGRRLPFTTGSRLAGGVGACVRDGKMILISSAGRPQEVIPASQIPLPGKHNLENALGAMLAAYLVGADVEAIRQGLADFKGVEHRIELCGERDGVRYYNDSKATNVDSLEKALQSFQEPIVLIAGGRDKHSNYNSLRVLIRQHVRHLVTLGEAAPLIEKSWSDLVSTQRAASMADAVRIASGRAQNGDVVLLSPACASYDMYRDFEERGRDFKKCVQDLIEPPASS
jgi:UDP-N-acetylmuramoylalanine--D-glutamate ligase